MTDSRQQWLESLAPRVRAEVEAEIADYEDPTNVEYQDDEEDWEPGPDWTYEIGVAFTGDELRALSEAVGREHDIGAFIKRLALNEARAIQAKRRLAEAD